MFGGNSLDLLYELYNNTTAISNNTIDNSNNITIRGINLKSEHALTNDQIKCLERIANYIHEPVQNDKFITISGPAGCGKTTLLKLVITYNNSLGAHRKQILGCALTHKARKVLDQTINQNNSMKIPTVTVASLLKKEKKAGYV